MGLEPQTRLGTSGPRPLITHKRIRNFTHPPLYSSAWTMDLILRKSLCRSRWARLMTCLWMSRQMNGWMSEWYIWSGEMNGYERLSDFFLSFFLTNTSHWIWSQRDCYSLQSRFFLFLYAPVNIQKINFCNVSNNTTAFCVGNDI